MGKNRSTVRKFLYDQSDGACAICGRPSLHLEVSHIVPISAGGSPDISNSTLLCADCHREFASFNIREVDFIDYLARVLELDPSFQDVTLWSPVQAHQNLRADILVKRNVQNRWEDLVIECKTYSAFSSDRFAATIQQVQEYRKYTGDRKYVLAFPGRLSSEQQNILHSNNVEMWDINYIATNFRRQIEQIQHPYFQLLLQAVKEREDQIAQDLLIQLKSCKPGKENWATYQKLIAKILEYLFCPPLRSPIEELSDISRVNRRDLIMPNYAPDGFWKFMRDTYKAEYVVIDTKNYKGAVKKKEVLQVANYLKPHGAGLFGLIICRTSGDNGCLHTLREQWMAYRKMIILLNDDDIEAMVLSKASKRNPEDIISQKIEVFRLSL